MQGMTPEQGPEAEGALREATFRELAGIDGGRINLNQFGAHRPLPLVGPDGEPITVIVDGFRVGPN
jgi:hypothetical protein